MTVPQLARLATNVLAEEHPGHVMAAAPLVADEARAILAIEAAILDSARRRRARRAAVAGALAIAATLALLVGWRVVRPSAPDASRTSSLPAPTTIVSAQANTLAPGVTVIRGGRELASSDGVALESSDRVVTAETGRTAITLSTGTHIVVDSASDLTIAERGPTMAFSLIAGRVHADVARLHTGERFLVRTADSEVEVRGTSFDVAVVVRSACGGGTTTRVAVREGVVVVRTAGREERVGKGETWPLDCAAAAAEGADGRVAPAVVLGASSSTSTEALPRPTPRAPTPLGAGPAAAVTLPAPSAAATSSSSSSSDLAAQNALFAEASAARRRGDVPSAIAAYDRLALRYPSSPLAENALVERMRLLGTSDAHRGADAARVYLARYPRGFARSEANDLVAKEK